MGVKISDRLASLDAFRGLTIAGMILVNTPGSWEFVYPPLLHARWEGCTPTDLVFPFFLYVVGVAMWYSFKRFDDQTRGKAALKIFRRAASIFLIGILLNAFPFYNIDLPSLRIMGVLQRIALAFLFGALICVYIPRKFLHWVAGLILLGYWALLATTGGVDPYGLENNLARQVDMAVLGADHLYGGFGIPFDPEGLLSTVPAVATVIIGYLIGSFIDRGKLTNTTFFTLLIAGIIGIVLGAVWGSTFPIIKALWTSSYVVYTAGIATILLAVFLYVIDVRQIKRWAQPLIVFGLNPLFIYALSGIIIQVMWMITWDVNGETVSLQEAIYDGLSSVLGMMNGSLTFALLYVALHWLIAFWLYKRKIFIKV